MALLLLPDSWQQREQGAFVFKNKKMADTKDRREGKRA